MRATVGSYPLSKIISSLFDIAKLPSKVVGLVAVVATLLLFTRGGLARTLQLDGFMDRHGHYVGVVWLAAVGLLILNATIGFIRMLRRQRKKRRWRKAVPSVIEGLDRVELAVLREFTLQGRNAILLPIDHPTVAGLLNRRVLIRVGQVGHQDLPGFMFPVAMNPDFREGMSDEDLGMHPPLSGDDRARFLSQRPAFVAESLRGEQRWLHD